MGNLVGTLVGAVVGAFVGPLVGTLVDPLVGSNFAVRVLCACQIAREAQEPKWKRKPKSSELSIECPENLLMGDRFLSSAGAGGNCVRPMRLPNPSPVLDKNCAPMGPEVLCSTGARVWRRAPMAFPYYSSVLDKFQSAILRLF